MQLLSVALCFILKVNEYNIPFNKKVHCLNVANSFWLLIKNCSEEDLNRARILGWCVEWVCFDVS